MFGLCLTGLLFPDFRPGSPDGEPSGIGASATRFRWKITPPISYASVWCVYVEMDYHYSSRCIYLVYVSAIPTVLSSSGIGKFDVDDDFALHFANLQSVCDF